MGELQIGDQDISDMTNPELLDWMQERKGGYKLHKKTAAIWLAIERSLDQQGIPATVRGLFYQCENVYHVVEKTAAGYGRVQRQVLAMRRLGVLPYGFISDSTRWMRLPQMYTGLEAAAEHWRKAYRKNHWDSQRDYVQVWCEKDAIAGILNDITSEWGVPLLVVRGYPSETFAFEAAEDIKRQSKPAYAYYFGDWDKHGVGISDDIKLKLGDFGANVQFERVTVEPWQIEKWGLPTRPTKDPDWAEYVEVDAVPTNKLRELVKDSIVQHIDKDAYDKALRVEELERETLNTVMHNSGLV